MDNVIQLNIYSNMTLEKLMDTSNVAMKTNNIHLMTELMKEFSRRLKIEGKGLYQQVESIKGSL